MIYILQTFLYGSPFYFAITLAVRFITIYFAVKLIGQDFIKIFKGVYCPVCTPDIEKATKFSLIEKATIIQNNQEIFICKPCKLVWLSEDIAKANAQDYKKFMRTLGLKGLWKELKDVDLL